MSVPAARLARSLIIYVPPRRRGQRLAELTERLAGRPSEPLRARHVSGYTITCDLADVVQRTLFYRGTYEPVTSARIAAALRQGDTFLDVGANVGHYTFLAASMVGPAGHVHAIEASRPTAERLHADVQINGLEDRVTVHNVAAFDRATLLRIREPGDWTQVGERAVESAPDGNADVPAARLEELLPGLRPAVVKVDVEGADLRALRGMSSLLQEDSVRLAVVEAQPHLLARHGDTLEAMLAFMRGLSYVPEPIDEPYAAPSIAFTPLRTR